MKDYNELECNVTVEITQREYKLLQRTTGRVQACVDFLEAMESHYIEINDILRMLGYSELACDREISKAQKEAKEKGIEVPKL